MYQREGWLYMKEEQSVKREFYIDMYKAFAIVLVLIGHTDPPFFKWIYSFHMPLFFFLSGYLYKKNSEIGFVQNEKKLIVKYIYPYFILCGINLILQMLKLFIIDSYTSAQLITAGCKYIVGIIFSRGTVEWMPNCTPLWFLTALFMALSIFFIIMRLNRKIQWSTIVLCMLLSGLMSYFKTPKLIWNTDTALMAVGFLGGGYWFNRISIYNRVLEHKQIYFIIACIFAVIGSVAINMNPVKEVSFDNNRYGNVILMIITAFLLVIATMIFCILVNYESKLVKTICKVGKHTMFIMAFDYFSMTILLLIYHVMFNREPMWMEKAIFKMFVLVIGYFIWKTIARMTKNKFMQSL